MITAIIIAKNEQDRIKAALESVKWADEIILADNGSADKTKQIAREYTTKIFEYEGLDFSTIRNRAAQNSTSDWILYIDADERVLSSLKDEIESQITMGDISAFAISRKNIIFGTEVRYGPYSKDWVIRLFRKKDFKSWIGKLHEQPTFNGKLGYLKNPLLHLTHRDLDQIVAKSLEWSKIEAQLLYDTNHPKMSASRFIKVFFSEIFNQGIKRKGFFGEGVGVMDSLLQAFSTLMTYIRLWQLQQEKPLSKTYDEIDEDLVKNKFNQ